jgi:hypothetical protein
MQENCLNQRWGFEFGAVTNIDITFKLGKKQEMCKRSISPRFLCILHVM